MESDQVAYLINTTPKYFYLLPLHITLLQRYADCMQWTIFIATEVPTHSLLHNLVQKFPNVQILPLSQENEGFIHSRAAAAAQLPSRFKYVFPIQEDFLLEGRPMENVIQEALEIMQEDRNISSARLMPCPGPRGDLLYKNTIWKVLEYPQKDDMLFTYQATLWRREAYVAYMQALVRLLDPLSPEAQKEAALKNNLAEIAPGQKVLQSQGGIHIAWPREGQQPNAVYLAPWPYRPTAVVKGKLQAWAEELAERERVSLAQGPSLR